MNKLAPIAFVVIAALSVTACTSTQRTLSGAAIGGGAGAVAGGAIAGTPGAVIGGAGGAALGVAVANK